MDEPAKKSLADTLSQILEKRRFSDGMRTALKLVFVDGKSAYDAADATGVSLQKLYLRRREVEDLIEHAYPAGWKQTVVFHAPEAQPAVDAFQQKLLRLHRIAETEKVTQKVKATALKKVAPLKATPIKAVRTPAKKGIKKG